MFAATSRPRRRTVPEVFPTQPVPNAGDVVTSPDTSSTVPVSPFLLEITEILESGAFCKTPPPVPTDESPGPPHLNSQYKLTPEIMANNRYQTILRNMCPHALLKKFCYQSESCKALNKYFICIDWLGGRCQSPDSAHLLLEMRYRVKGKEIVLHNVYVAHVLPTCKSITQGGGHLCPKEDCKAGKTPWGHDNEELRAAKFQELSDIKSSNVIAEQNRAQMATPLQVQRMHDTSLHPSKRNTQAKRLKSKLNRQKDSKDYLGDERPRADIREELTRFRRERNVQQ